MLTALLFLFFSLFFSFLAGGGRLVQPVGMFWLKLFLFSWTVFFFNGFSFLGQNSWTKSSHTLEICFWTCCHVSAAPPCPCCPSCMLTVCPVLCLLGVSGCHLLASMLATVPCKFIFWGSFQNSGVNLVLCWSCKILVAKIRPSQPPWTPHG